MCMKRILSLLLLLLCLPGCKTLRSMETLPETITETKPAETPLTEIITTPVFVVPEDVTVVDETAFAGYDTTIITEITVGAWVERLDFAWLNTLPSLTTVTVDADNPFYQSVLLPYDQGFVVLSLEESEMLYLHAPANADVVLDAEGIDTPYTPEMPVTLYTSGGSLQVYFERYEQGSAWFLDSITYGEHTKTIGYTMQLTGNRNFDVFRAGDIFVAQMSYYTWSHAYVFTGRDVLELNPQYGDLTGFEMDDGLILYPDENGQLCYRKTPHNMVAIQTYDWYIGFLTGPDQTWKEEGLVQFAGGEMHFAPQKIHTIADYFAMQDTTVEEWFEKVKANGLNAGFATLEDVYAYSLSLLPPEPEIAEDTRQPLELWQNRELDVPCADFAAADTVEELKNLAADYDFPDWDNRIPFIEAFVTGDVTTMEALAGVPSGMYAEFAEVEVARWIAWLEKDKYQNDVLRFLFILRDYPMETLALSPETWLYGTVEEGMDGTFLTFPQHTPTAEAEKDLHTFLNYMFVTLPQNNDMTYNERFRLTCYLAIRFGAEEGLTLPQIQEYARLCFGIEDFQPSDSHLWDGVYICPGHGGSYQAFRFLTVNRGPVTDTTWVVEVQFYADPSYLVRSHVYRYYLDLVDGVWTFRVVDEVEKGSWAPHKRQM